MNITLLFTDLTIEAYVVDIEKSFTIYKSMVLWYYIIKIKNNNKK